MLGKQFNYSGRGLCSRNKLRRDPQKLLSGSLVLHHFFSELLEKIVHDVA
jgi:hypothetical protein